MREAEAPPAPASFADPEFLLNHARSLLDFYYPKCLDTTVGGYIAQFDDDGSIFDPLTRHLVWSTRYLYNFDMAAQHNLLGDAVDAAQHGLAFLEQAHHDSRYGGYFWILKGREPVDDRKFAYGHAFVLLAAASSLLAGLESRSVLDDVDRVLEDRFWRHSEGLYVDEITRDWSMVAPYRGQNANMHMVEALLEAYAATHDPRYLDRAETVSTRIVLDLGSQANGLVWEHYRPDWTVDWEYNRETPRDLFRPYGYLSGHLMEWAKLLLLLERQRPADWLLPAAQRLFQAAVDHAWDQEFGGFLYSFAPDGTIVDDDKYYWVMAEAVAGAAMLVVRTGDPRYLEWYNRTWQFIWEHMVDHRYGAWYSLLSRDNRRKQPDFSRGKVDFYHQLSACLLAAEAFQDQSSATGK